VPLWSFAGTLLSCTAKWRSKRLPLSALSLGWETPLAYSHRLCSSLSQIDPKLFGVQIVASDGGPTVESATEGRALRVLVNEVVPVPRLALTSPQLCEVVVPMDSMVDADKERGRLRSQIEKLRSAIGPLQQRLGSEGFRSKASPAIIEEVQSTLREKEEQLRLLESRLLELAERGNASS
jgi:hypothetical protein